MLFRLFPLVLAMFAVGTDGFVIAGLLPAIAADLAVSTPVAGQLVSMFALALAVAAPAIGAVAGRVDQRTVLLVGLGVFVIGNAATAVGSSYAAVLAARVLTAVGAGAIGATAFTVAATMTAPQRRGRALALVMGGLTAATALGLPLGTYLGSADWRITLWAVAGAGMVAALGVVLGVPPVVLPATSLRTRMAPLRERWVQQVLLAVLLTRAGIHVLHLSRRREQRGDRGLARAVHAPAAAGGSARWAAPCWSG